VPGSGIVSFAPDASELQPSFTTMDSPQQHSALGWYWNDGFHRGCAFWCDSEDDGHYYGMIRACPKLGKPVPEKILAAPEPINHDDVYLDFKVRIRKGDPNLMFWEDVRRRAKYKGYSAYIGRKLGDLYYQAFVDYPEAKHTPPPSDFMLEMDSSFDMGVVGLVLINDPLLVF
jgi:hypothetical protein